MILINLVPDGQEAEEVFRKISRAVGPIPGKPLDRLSGVYSF